MERLNARRLAALVSRSLNMWCIGIKTAGMNTLAGDFPAV